jgi:hypothetical protein
MIVIMIWWTLCFGLFVGGVLWNFIWNEAFNHNVGRMKMGGFYE